MRATSCSLTAPPFKKQDRFDPCDETICWLIFSRSRLQTAWDVFLPCSHLAPLLLCSPAKCPRAAPWRRFTWMGSPRPLVWWRWDGTQSWASALWRAARNRLWSALSRQVGVILCWLVIVSFLRLTQGVILAVALFPSVILNGVTKHASTCF